MINFTGLFYTFEGIILSGVTYRLWHSYQKSKNPVTKNFAYVGFFLAISLFIFGFFCLAFPQNYRVLKIIVLIAWIPLFISSAFGLRAFFSLKLEQVSPNFAFLVAAFFGSLMLFLQGSYTGYPRVVQGITEWNLHPTAFLLYIILVLTFTIPLTITFIQSGLKDPKVRVRSFGMATGFLLAGIGAILNSSVGWLIVASGDIILSLGFLSVAFIFFFTKPPLE